MIMRFLFMTFAMLIVLWGACTPFSNRYERITGDRLRALSINFSPLPEGAPGDTVRLRLYCAGDSVISSTWKISTNVIIDEYGAVAAKDIGPLKIVSSEAHFPDSIDLRFVVPDSTFYTTQAVEKMLNVLRPQLPAALRDSSQSVLAGLVADFASMDFNNPASLAGFMARWGTLVNSMGAEELYGATAALSAIFSVNAYIYGDLIAHDGKKLVTRVNFSIRYNSRLAANPLTAGLFPVNHNPSLRWLGIYRVKGDRANGFDPSIPEAADSFNLQYLVNLQDPLLVKDTVDIDTGYLYFAAVDSGLTWMRPDSEGRPKPMRLKENSTVFVKTPVVNLWFAATAGDSIRIPLIVPDSVMINANGKSLVGLVEGRLATGLDTIVEKAGPGTFRVKALVDSIVYDTSLDQKTVTPRTVVLTRWQIVPETSLDLFCLTRDMGRVPGGSAGAENYTFTWFYENVDAGITAGPLDSLMVITPSGGSVAPLLPSQDPAMKHGKIWVAVSDYFYGEFNRPVGYAQIGVDVYFRYTPAYIESMKNKK